MSQCLCWWNPFTQVLTSDVNKDWTCKDKDKDKDKDQDPKDQAKDKDFIFTMYKDLQGLYFLQSPCKYLPTIKEWQ